MFGAFKFNKSEWLTSGFHLVILVFAVQDESGRLWPYALGAVAIVSFFAWILAYRRYRYIHDLPTSKVASAAQGYVELFGRSERLDGEPLLSKLTGLPCCWYRYYIERKTSGDKWQYEDSGTSIAHFFLVDDTGRCVVSPEGAEVLSSRKQVWTEGNYRYTEWLLLSQGPLYAVGVTDKFPDLAALKRQLEKAGKAAAFWLVGRQQAVRSFRLEALSQGIPVYDEISKAVASLAAAVRFRRRMERAAIPVSRSIRRSAHSPPPIAPQLARERVWALRLVAPMAGS